MYLSELSVLRAFLPLGHLWNANFTVRGGLELVQHGGPERPREGVDVERLCVVGIAVQRRSGVEPGQSTERQLAPWGLVALSGGKLRNNGTD